MKKIFSIFISVILAFSLCSSMAFAAGSAVFGAVLACLKDVSLSEILDFAKSILNGFSDSLSKRTEAARIYYFYVILNDELSSGKSVFDDTGKKFSDDIYDFYFEEYYNASTNYDVYLSDGDIFMTAAGFNDVPFSISLCRFAEFSGTSNVGILKPEQLKPAALKNFKNYYDSMLARYIIENGETATDPAPGKNGLEIAPAYVTSDELIEGLYKDNSSYSPKSETWKLTWRNNPQGQFYDYNGYTYTLNHIGLSNDSKGYTNFSDLYLLPYFRNPDGTEYYSQYQLHIYLKEWDDPNSDIYLACDIYSYLSDFSGTLVETCSDLHLLDMSKDNLPFKLAIDFPQYGAQEITGRFYKTNSDYATHTSSTSFSGWVSNHDKTVRNNIFKVFSSDLSGYYDLSNSTTLRFETRTREFNDPIFANFNNPEKNDGVTDVGFLASSELIRFTYSDIDISKIGKGQIVTINGDTIYNYNITNPETGDSSKFGDYITNNYTYITNNNGGSSGGTVGGKVEVGGKIDVGGSVGVDVNVNVNGAGGTSLNPSDFTSGDTVDTKKYFDSALEMSENTQNFLGDFFSFLPPQVLALILFGLTMAIVCRVGGR